jgi:hypothetical protein
MSTDRDDGNRAEEDPDADPEMKSDKAGQQPDQAEGADDPAETSGT